MKLLKSLGHFWRSSLQLRMITGVVTISILITLATGLFVIKQISSGLAEKRVEFALAEARNENQLANAQLRQSSTARDLDEQLKGVVSTLLVRGQERGFSAAVYGPIDSAVAVPGIRVGAPLLASSVPDNIKSQVRNSSQQMWTYTKVQYQQEPAVPGVVVANRIKVPASGEEYGLFLIFPMQDEEQTISLLRRSLLTAGGLLLLMLVGLMGLALAHVLRPIRAARQVAEQISSGVLDQRIEVKGEDDIARLATSFNQMASNLQGQISKLQGLSRLQQRFVADVSHELRTPLTTVRMASDLLHDHIAELDPMSARSVELLHAELGRFENLLAELLEMSRIDSGAAEVQYRRVDLVDVALRAVALTRPLAIKRQVQVSFTPGDAVIADLDVRRVDRIVRNLLVNALDHSGSTKILITLAETERAVGLSIRDFGAGLTAEQSERVFDRFWRADPARSRSSGGSGLGMSIALEDAKLHHGRLEVRSKSGLGTQFCLTLPKFQAELAGTSPIEFDADLGGGSNG